MKTLIPLEPFNLFCYKQPVRSRRSSSISISNSTRATLKNSKGNINNGVGDRGGVGGKGFGGGVKMNNMSIKRSTTSSSSLSLSSTTTPYHDPAGIQAIVQIIQKEVIVRLDNVMSTNAANTNESTYLLELRQRSIQAIDDGSITNSQKPFPPILDLLYYTAYLF